MSAGLFERPREGRVLVIFLPARPLWERWAFVFAKMSDEIAGAWLLPTYCPFVKVTGDEEQQAGSRDDFLLAPVKLSLAAAS